MKATSIPQHEATFRQTGIDSSGTKFILTDEFAKIQDKAGGQIALVDCVKQVPDKSYYYEEEFPKERIVLHFTAGYLKGDIAQLSRKSVEVSVPFVIARSGHIYNLWASKYWSYHLGAGAIGGNTAMSQRSIGIEISNIGFLRKKTGGLLHTVYSTEDVYCTDKETTFFQKLPSPYRGEQYYATFTNAQYVALVQLLRFLTARYKIPRTFLPVAKRFDPFASTAEAEGFKGICSHVNFRPTGKWDIGPAFNWGKLEKGLKIGA
ncbi:MAG TPA: N-acetylmuramoyl-L-alanine amidase [Saprospiraceae bacterium]|nr:N-acetylmuramoyl-L-alanine amidase [Saprospiraceae bacterium]